MSDTATAWAAGFFEGEGGFSRASNRGSVVVQCTQSDREPLDRLVRILGVGKVYGPYGPYKTQSKPYFVWSAAGIKAAQAVRQMTPYLSNRRRLQWEAAVAG